MGKNAVNKSIQAYVYSLLDGQATVQASAVAVGSIAQVEFKNIVESSVSSEEDVSMSIVRFQDSLANAKTLPDYNIGSGLLLIPSDMNLSMGKYEGYNDQLVYSSDDTPLGKIAPHPALKPVVTQPVTPEPDFPEPVTPEPVTPEPDFPDPVTPVPVTPEPDLESSLNEIEGDPPSGGSPAPVTKLQAHEDNKETLIIGLVVIFGIGFPIYKLIR